MSLLSYVADDKLSRVLFQLFQYVMCCTVLITSDIIYNVRCLSDVSHYLFSNIFLAAHGVFFVLFRFEGSIRSVILRYYATGAVCGNENGT